MSRREALKQKYADAFAEIDEVREELDSVVKELHSLEHRSALLHDSFAKYGYAPHLRIYNDIPLSSNGSTHSTCSCQAEEERKPCWAQRDSHREKAMKFYNQPKVRQYFHKGLLWRGVCSEKVLFFELFVDLLYVGIISIGGDSAAEEPTGEAFLHFCIKFIMSWKLWSDVTAIISTLEAGVYLLIFLINFNC